MGALNRPGSGPGGRGRWWTGPVVDGAGGGRGGPDRLSGPAMTDDILLDTSHLLCPLPVLKARKRLAAMAPGQVLRLVTTDPAAVVDVPHFCAEAGHAVLSVAPAGNGGCTFRIRRG